VFFTLRQPVLEEPEVGCPTGHELTAVGDAFFPPFIYRDDDENKGFLIGYMQAAERELGCPITVELMPWHEAMARVRDGRADILLGVSETDERRNAYAFTERLLTLKAHLFSRREDFHITEVEDLPKEAVVGVEEADIVHETLRGRYPGLELRPFPTQKAALKALASGEIDAVAADYYSGRWVVEQLNLKNEVKVVGHPFLEGAYGVAVRKDNQRLLTPLTEAIARVKESGEARRLQDAWFGEHYFSQTFPWRRLAVASAVVGALLLALALWVAGLRAAVRRGTRGLRASEERFRLLVQNFPDAIVAHARGRIIYANPAALALFGASKPDELIGSDAIERFTMGEEASPLSGELTVPGRQTELLRLDGRRVVVEVSTADMRIGEQDAKLVTLRDITERRLLEDQLRQSQRLEAVGRLAGGVAHDFNNLLTVILTMCDLLEPELEPELRPDLETIRSTGLRAAALTRQLLAFSRRTELRPRIVDLNEVVRDTSKLFSRLLGEDVPLVTELGEPLPPVYADPAQLAQVLMNLAINARDAMPQGGRLTLRTRATELEERTAIGGVQIAAGRYVELAVKDEGIGMERGITQRIFEPFFTTKEPDKGTGLGLSVVFGIVNQSGGHIELATAPGAGTTFYVRLPVATSESPLSIEESPAVGKRLPRGTETILVVEDAVDVARSVERTLSRLGYSVIVALHPDQAETYFKEHSDIALVITDVVMPGITGPVLAARLRVRRPGLSVLFMSGYEHGLVDGAEHLLRKPFSTEALAESVRRAIGSS
jgi:PAS domain S-box-containing protein